MTILFAVLIDWYWATRYHLGYRTRFPDSR